MREIEAKFQELDKRNEGALIAYVTGGDPEPEYTPKIVEALINGGADIVELGIPFSDPIADGPTIQQASVRALNSGTTPKKVLEIAEVVKRKHDVPLVILTYYNIIYRMGLERFFDLAEKSGVNGVIVPDIVIDDSADYKRAAKNHNIDAIFLAAPSTPDIRLEKIISQSSGFLYLVSVFGVTGARENLQDQSVEFIKKAASIAHGRIRLAVGFGISKPSHVRRVIQSGADGAIVGSSFVKIIEQNLKDEERILVKLENYAHKLKEATLKGKDNKS